MPGEPEIGTESSFSGRNSSSGAGDGASRSLEALLAEVNALALRLRQLARGARRADNLPSCGESVLSILLRHGPQTVPRIARRHGTSRQNIQTLVNRLESEGSVELSGNPAHKRSALVRLTEHGRAWLVAAQSGEQQFAAALSRGVPEAEMRSAAELLRRLRELLSTTGTVVPREPHGTDVAGGNFASLAAAPPPEAAAWGMQADENELPLSLL